MLLGIRWGSLRTKIIAWSFVPTALILLAVALVTFTAYQQVTQDLVIERDRELVRLSAGQLAAKLTQYTNLLATEARTADIYQNDPVVQRIALKRAGNRLVVFDGGVLILNDHGMVVAAEPERPEIMGQDWSNRSYFRQMLRAPGPVFSNIVADGPGGAEVIVVAVPITGDQGQFLGTMAGMFRLGVTTISAFYGGIVKLRIGQSGSAYLVDGQGRVIYHSDPDRVGNDFSAQRVVQRVLSGQVNALRSQDLAGRDIVAGFAPLPGTPWGLVTEESWAALIRPSQGYRQFLILLLALGVLVPALVVAVGVRRITSPIIDLIAAAHAVAGGDFGQTITAATGDEIEDLAEQFNRMSAHLQISYSRLERMVAERTTELATLSAIAAVVSRSLDLDEILSNALDKSLQVMKVETGAIYLLDDETDILSVVAQRGFNPQFVAGIDKLRVGEGFSGRVAQSGQPLVVRNVSSDPRLTRMVVREEGLRSLASVPIRFKGKVLGVLFAVTHGYREFTDQDVDLLTAIGHQVGVAIENARLFEAERWRRQQATLLAEMATLTSGALDLDRVLHLTAEYAVDVFKVDYCLICLRPESGAALQCAIEKGFPPQVSAAIKGATFRPNDKTRQVVLENLQPLIIEDALTEPYVVPQDVALPQMQSVLIVPLEVGGRRLGFMLLGTQPSKQRHFTVDEGELAMAMANQAALAIDGARLFKAEQRRAEQFRAISEVGHRITSILEIDEVLAQIVSLIQDTFGYYHVAIGLIEGDEVVYRVGAGNLWDDPNFQFEPARLKVGQEGTTGWVAGVGETLLVSDVSQEPQYVWMRGSETRSELTVPVKTKREIIGVLDIQSDQLNAFDDSDVLVLQSLANQASVAIENARLLAAERRRADELDALRANVADISAELKLSDLLRAILERAVDLMGVTFGELGLYNEATQEIHIVASYNMVKDFSGTRMALGEGAMGRVAQTRQPLIIQDHHTWDGRSSKYAEIDWRSTMVVPLIAAGRLVGTIGVGHADPVRQFGPADQHLLDLFAQQAAIAVRNAQLYAQTRQMAVLEERQRLARDLHDSATQSLYGVTMFAEAAARLLKSGEIKAAIDHMGEVRETAQEALQEMRVLIFELRPPILEKEGLVTALQTRLEMVEERSGLETRFEAEKIVDLPPDIEEGLYRIAQEILNNILKHAQAQEVTVQLYQDQQNVILEVADDGIGFDPSAVRDQGGLGLAGMEERVALAGGQLRVSSKPGQGTTVRVEVGQ